MSNKQAVITYQLDKAYQIDAILVMGQNKVEWHLSEFSLYVGYDPTWSNNTPCPGGPFAMRDANYGTYSFPEAPWPYQTGTDFPNGVEAWCPLQGNYVSFVREANADPPLDPLVLCNFGVIASPSGIPQRFTHLASSITVK